MLYYRDIWMVRKYLAAQTTTLLELAAALRRTIL